jgi:hypothetical protein
MIKEFTDTDAELARCIHSRIKQELNGLPLNNVESKKIIREYMMELVTEIINEVLPE